MFLFYQKNEDELPYSGTIVKVGYNKYLLFNNTRYDERATLKPRDYHFPIKVSIKATKEELLQDVEVIRELIDQVYQFSRMYWKSINQQSLPVTINTPKWLQKFTPIFNMISYRTLAGKVFAFCKRLIQMSVLIRCNSNLLFKQPCKMLLVFKA